MTFLPILILILYPLRRATVFPKSANKETLPEYAQYTILIAFDRHGSAYLIRIGISSYEGGSHFERNGFKMQKRTISKCINPLLYYM